MEQAKDTTPNAGTQEQPMETAGSSRAELKKQQRDAQRLQEFQEDKRTTLTGAKWLPLTQRLLRRDRRNLVDSTWTAWMRSRAPDPTAAKLIFPEPMAPELVTTADSDRLADTRSPETAGLTTPASARARSKMSRGGRGGRGGSRS